MEEEWEYEEAVSDVAGLIDEYLDRSYPGITKLEHLQRGMLITWSIFSRTCAQLGGVRTFVDATADLIRSAVVKLKWNEPVEDNNGNQKAN